MILGNNSIDKEWAKFRKYLNFFDKDYKKEIFLHLKYCIILNSSENESGKIEFYVYL